MLSEDEVGIEIGAWMAAVFIDDELEMQTVAFAFTGRKSKGGRLAVHFEPAVAGEGTGQSVGLCIERDLFEGKVASRRGIVDCNCSVLDRDALELHLLSRKRARRGRQANGFILDSQPQLRAHQPRLDEIDFAAHERRQRDFEVQLGGPDVSARRRIHHLHVGELKIRRRQQFEINAAADLHLLAEQVRELSFDQASLGIPINEVRHRQSGAQNNHENDGENCENVAHGLKVALGAQLPENAMANRQSVNASSATQHSAFRGATVADCAPFPRKPHKPAPRRGPLPREIRPI